MHDSQHSTHQVSALSTEGQTHPTSYLDEEILGTMESMMHTYGYTAEAFDKEIYRQRGAKEKALLQSSSEWSQLLLFFMKIRGSFSFQAFFGTLIVLNAITMGFEADTDSSMKGVYETLENVFCTFFLIELIIRVIGSPINPWHDVPLMIDGFIVLVSVIDNWILSASGLRDDSNLDLSVLTVLRILRIVRVIRIFRTITVFRPVRVLLEGMAHAVYNLFWISLLLLVMFYCVALTLRMMLTEVDRTSPTRSVVDEYFSSIGKCITTSIEVLLRGFDWTDKITTPLINDSDSVAAGIMWIVFVCSVHVCVGNLIVAVFVEQLIATAKESDGQIKREQFVTKDVNIQLLKKLFGDLDIEKCGRIPRKEFKVKLQDPVIAHAFGVAPDEVETFVDSLDYFGNADVRIDDLIFAMLKLRAGEKSVDMMCFDYQLKHILRQIQQTPHQIKELTLQLEKFESRLGHLHDDMTDTKKGCVEILDGVPRRLDALEEQMRSFLARVNPVTSSSVTNASKAVSAAHLRDSYEIADEMRELRRVMSLAKVAVQSSACVPTDTSI